MAGLSRRGFLRTAAAAAVVGTSSTLAAPAFAKAALDAAGLRATSGHVQIPQPFDPAAWSASLDGAKVLGRVSSCARSSGSTSAPAR